MHAFQIINNIISDRSRKWTIGKLHACTKRSIIAWWRCIEKETEREGQRIGEVENSENAWILWTMLTVDCVTAASFWMGRTIRVPNGNWIDNFWLCRVRFGFPYHACHSLIGRLTFALCIRIEWFKLFLTSQIIQRCLLCCGIFRKTSSLHKHFRAYVNMVEKNRNMTFCLHSRVVFHHPRRLICRIQIQNRKKQQQTNKLIEFHGSFVFRIFINCIFPKSKWWESMHEIW